MLHSLLRRAYQTGGLVYYYLFLGPRGRGRPATTDRWDAQYRTGHWDNFETVDEMPRYAVIGSYIRNYAVSPTVLDVGCGYGRLLTELGQSSFADYVGIDLSEEAINRAQRLAGPNVRFCVADFTGWRTDSAFDLVVFNDTLYYADHPLAVLEHYAGMLVEGGAIIIGMFRHRNTMVIWRDIGRCFKFIHSLEVKNGKGELTDIRVLVPLGGPIRNEGFLTNPKVDSQTLVRTPARQPHFSSDLRADQEESAEPG